MRKTIARGAAAFGALIFAVIGLTGCTSVSSVQKREMPLEEEAPRRIRVLVARGVQRIDLESEGAFLVSRGRRLPLPNSISLFIVDNAYITAGRNSYPLPVMLEAPRTLKMNGETYSGELHIHESVIVNYVPLEDYIRGVVASEVPVDWPVEALKSQAVVSRTYALYMMARNKDELYDVDSTEKYQKFKHTEGGQKIELAVKQTEGLIILYRNSPIEAFYHANSGGVTESAGDVFQISLPYLRSVSDRYSVMDNNSEWSISIRAEEIKSRLSALGETVYKDPLLDVSVHSRTASGRVKEFSLLFGRSERVLIKGNSFRLAMDSKAFKSLLIDKIEKSRSGGVIVFAFYGRGYGHGVGMSQWGAKAMAEKGFSFRDIIFYYYKNTRLGNYRMVAPESDSGAGHVISLSQEPERTHS